MNLFRHVQRGRGAGHSPPPPLSGVAVLSHRPARRGAETAPPIVHEVLDAPGQPIDELTRRNMETRFVHDFSQVRLHTDADAAASAAAVGAAAYTVGRHVVFGPNQFDPATGSGRTLLAHELAHVAQQSPAPPPTGAPLRINDPHDASEHHARTAAARAVAGLAPVAAPIPAPARPTLQRDLGSNAPPTQSRSDPNAIIPIADLIRYVEAVEAAHPREPKAEIISRIRNQYYGDFKFQQLIPGATTSDIQIVPTGAGAAVSKVPRKITSRIGKEAHQHLTAHADENPTATEFGDNPSPYVQLVNGELIDLGHLVLALDALDYPTKGEPIPPEGQRGGFDFAAWAANAPFSEFGVPNSDPAGWVADLGLASVWMTQHETEGAARSGAPEKKLDHPDLDRYYQMSAPDQDLLGDMDAIGVFHQPTGRAAETLSQALRAYYLGAPPTHPAAVGRRWRMFCDHFGFTYHRAGTTISWDPAIRAVWIARINRFNDLANAEKKGAFLQTVRPGKPDRHTWPHTPAVLDRFLAFVKIRLERELASDSHVSKPQ